MASSTMTLRPRLRRSTKLQAAVVRRGTANVARIARLTKQLRSAIKQQKSINATLRMQKRGTTIRTKPVRFSHANRKWSAYERMLLSR